MGEQSNRTRVPGDPFPEYAELVERLEKLEQRKLGVSDLPMTALQTKLENDWQPSPGVLLPPQGITGSLVADRTITETKLEKRAVSGVVTSAGAVGAGTGFTAAKGAAGIYTLNFSPAFAAAPALIPVPHAAGQYASITARSASAVTVEIRTDAGVATDTEFSFQAKEI